MVAFTLYGTRGSTNTDRVRLTLADGGFTDYDFVLINLQKREQKVCRCSVVPEQNPTTLYLFLDKEITAIAH